MDIDIDKKQIFASTMCPICGLCSNPDPAFCASLYYGINGDQFIREIVSRIEKLLSVSPNSLEILSTFEGFSSLFCRPGRCPLYDKQCDIRFSSRIRCYKAFIEQNSGQLKLFTLSNVYQKWSGIELNKIGQNLDPIMDVPKQLTKGQRKKLRKAIKKAKKLIDKSSSIKTGIGNKLNVNNRTILHKNKKKVKKVTETLFFCNSNDKWKEKISQYLKKDEQYEDNNRQSSEVARH